MTALGVLVQVVWPLMVGVAVVVYLHRCATRIDERVEQVEATADDVDATARELRDTLTKVRRDVRTIRGWMRTRTDAPHERAGDTPTAEMPQSVPLTRDQRIRSKGAAARPPRHRMREPDDTD